MAFGDDIVVVPKDKDIRLAVMDSWDAATRQMYDDFLTLSLDEGYSQSSSEDFAYWATIETLELM